MMNDEEFKKKLEKILEDFYQIDKEVNDYLERNQLRSKEYLEKSSQNKKSTTDGNYFGF